MKIPKKLKIGGHQYVVVLCDADNMDGANGEQDRHRNRIRICKTDPLSQQEDTLLHEIIHALNGGLKEDIVDSLAGGLHQVLKDNNLLK